MANTWWWAHDGNDANNGTSRAQAKATLSAATGIFSLAGLATNDVINVVAPQPTPIPWTLVASEADVKAGTKGTNFTTNPGLVFQGSDDFGNHQKAYIKAATAHANGVRSMFRIVANTGWIVVNDLIYDATEKTADGASYRCCRMRDTGSPDPGPVLFQGCGILGGNGVLPSGDREFFAVDTTGPPAGSDLFYLFGCYTQNCLGVAPASGTTKKSWDHCLFYYDASSAIPGVYAQTLAGSSASALLGMTHCTVYVKTGNFALPPILGFTVNDLLNVGTLDVHSNLLYLESTLNPNPLARFVVDNVAGAKTGCTLAGTRGFNVILGGPSIVSGDVVADGFYEGVSDPDKDDSTGSDLYAGDTVQFLVQEATVFAHPTAQYAWDPLGNGAQFVVPKDLRPIAPYLTLGKDGSVPGALPAFIPSTAEPIVIEPEYINETLSWLTSVVTSYNGSAEQRMALRMQPRRRMELGLIIEDEAARRAEYRRLYASSGLIRVPLYQYATMLTQGSAVSATKIFFDPTRTDIRSNETVVVYRKSTGQAFVIEATTLASDGINTALPLAQALLTTDYIVPSLEGYLSQDPGLSMTSVSGAMVLDVLMADARTTFTRPGSATVFPTFDSLNVLEKRPLSIGDVQEVFDREPIIFDNETGKHTEEVHWLHPFVSGRRSFLIQRTMVPSDMDFWRDFLNFARGMREPFLMPTFRDDFVLNANPGMGATTMDVLTADYSTKYFPYDTYKRLRLEAPNGEVIYRKVSSVLVINPTVQRLTIPALPGTSQWNGTFRIGYLNRVRLASDEINLSHQPMDTMLELLVRTTDT